MELIVSVVKMRPVTLPALALSRSTCSLCWSRSWSSWIYCSFSLSSSTSLSLFFSRVFEAYPLAKLRRRNVKTACLPKKSICCLTDFSKFSSSPWSQQPCFLECAWPWVSCSNPWSWWCTVPRHITRCRTEFLRGEHHSLVAHRAHKPVNIVDF